MADTKINSLSYTNKDFDAIYEELLSMGDEISSKWKPSASNESDPGIVLIKENAIVGDKVNYNIDKNILEAFPSSVTQEGVARQLFEEQLACPANWYRAASGIINFRYIGTDAQTTEGLINAQAEIPQWTMVSDEDSSVTYTIIDFGKTITFNGVVNENGYKVLQGTPNEYTYGGSNVITFGALKNNRLYFQEYNVAQNGVFIANIDDEHNYWKRVDLLSTQEYGSLVYRFGVDKNQQCYIEFPSWSNEIIKGGIYIHYITTNGNNGNVASNILTRFANDVTVTPVYEQYDFEDITLNSDNVFMRNVSPIVNGEDPDTIEQMYNNYKKTVGVFNTLVTLRDYNLKIRSLDEDVSNGFACDRTNDVQSAYNIIHTQGGYTRRLRKEELTESPYAIKLYMTQFVNAINSPQNYNNSFDFVDNFGDEDLDDGESFNAVIDNSVDKVVEDLEEYKCMSHDFETVKRYKPLFFKNKYPINCSIIPRYKLTNEQLIDVKNNVINALYALLKSGSVEFGKGIDYDTVYDAIINSDNRISTIALEDIQYKTYAVYKGSYIKTPQLPTDTESSCRVEDKLIEVPVNDIFFAPEIPYELQEQMRSQGGNLVIGTYDPSDNSFTGIDGNVISSVEPVDEVINLDGDSLDKYIYFYETIEDKFYPIDKYNGVWKSPLQIYRYPFSTAFATDIYAKSVLNGNTPIIEPDKTFSRSIKQKEEGEYKASYITTESAIDLSTTHYNVRKNEAVQVFSPSYETEITFSIGNKLSYELDNDAPANQDYILGANEYVLVFRQLEGSDDYQWKLYREGDIIRCSRTLKATSSAQSYDPTITSPIYNMSSKQTCGPSLLSALGTSLSTTSPTIGTTSGKIFSSNPDNAPKLALYSADTVTYQINSVTEFISKCMIFSQDILSGSDTFEKRKRVELRLDNNYVYFWVLNTFTTDSSYSSGYKCVLFEQGEGEKTLLDNEVLFYASSDGSAIGTLGSGTKITRDVTAWDSEWACDRINIIDFYNYTIQERENIWVRINGSNSLMTYEQNITSFGEGSEVWLESGALSLDNTFTDVGSYIIHYLSQDGESNDLTLPTPEGTTIRSALQLVASDTSAQELLNGQSIKLMDENKNTLATLSNSGFILTDRACDYNGTDVDVRLVTLTNDYTPLGVMKFGNSTYSGDAEHVFNSSDGIDFMSDGSDIEIVTKFSAGNYLIPFRCSEGTSPIFSIDFNGTTRTISDIAMTATFLPNVMYYLDIGVSESEAGYNATITISNTTSQQIVELGKMFKYTMPETLKQDDAHTYNGKSYYWYVIMQRIKELDPRGEFDYGYKILDAERIDNPLDPSSFNDPAHIMNQFTICEMDIDAMERNGVSMGSIRILNNVRS